MTRDEIVEVTARGIYASWYAQPGYVPWVERGNSVKQEEARRMARSALSVLEAAGLAVVPAVPTEAMLATAWDVHTVGYDELKELWAVMIAAAEQVPNKYGRTKNESEGV
jgi:hypothetical protein